MIVPLLTGALLATVLVLVTRAAAFYVARRDMEAGMRRPDWDRDWADWADALNRDRREEAPPPDPLAEEIDALPSARLFPDPHNPFKPGLLYAPEVPGSIPHHEVADGGAYRFWSREEER